MFSKHIKPISLKDGKSMMVNLKKYDGKVVLRFKVGKKLVAKTLDLFIIPCSGAVDVEVSLKDEIIIAKRRIEGFGDISLTNPITAGRYYIKIIASNHEELQKISGVEVTHYFYYSVLYHLMLLIMSFTPDLRHDQIVCANSGAEDAA